MGFEGQEQSEGSIKKYFTGRDNVKVVCINPNKAEMESVLGIKTEKEPEYTGKDDKGIDQIRISIWAEGESGKQNLSFYIKNSTKTSSTGKIQVINAFGATTWLEKLDEIPENMSWYQSEGIRPAMDGEEALNSFFRNLLNCKRDARSQFVDMQKIIAGDVSELRTLANSFPNNKVGVIVGVKESTKDDGKVIYNTVVFQRAFTRAWADDNTSLAKAIQEFKDAGGAANIYFGEIPYTLTEVNPKELAFFKRTSVTPAESSTGGIKAAF